MKRKYEHRIRILGLLPAPGWRAFDTWKNEDGSVEVMELPVVGFGIVRHSFRLEDSSNDWTDGDDDEVYPLIYWEEFKSAIRPSELEDYISNAVITVCPPGNEYDKEKAEADLTDKLALQKRAAVKVAS